jgi:hypothetical protein
MDGTVLAGLHYSSLCFVSALDLHIMFVLLILSLFCCCCREYIFNRCLLDSFIHFTCSGCNYIFPFLRKIACVAGGRDCPVGPADEGDESEVAVDRLPRSHLRFTSVDDDPSLACLSSLDRSASMATWRRPTGERRRRLSDASFVHIGVVHMRTGRS